MRRICVIGCSGGGKTTFAKLVARELGLPHLELDSLYHQAGWNSLASEEFRAMVTDFTAGDRWVVDGNYVTDIGDITWEAADTIFWIDTSRVIRRTLGRLLLRKELWNGNRERFREVVSRDPERSIVVWAWKMHGKYTKRYEMAMGDPGWGHIRFVRLTSTSEVRRFLRSLEDQSS